MNLCFLCCANGKALSNMKALFAETCEAQRGKKNKVTIHNCIEKETAADVSCKIFPIRSYTLQLNPTQTEHRDLGNPGTWQGKLSWF